MALVTLMSRPYRQWRRSLGQVLKQSITRALTSSISAHLTQSWLPSLYESAATMRNALSRRLITQTLVPTSIVPPGAPRLVLRQFSSVSVPSATLINGGVAATISGAGAPMVRTAVGFWLLGCCGTHPHHSSPAATAHSWVLELGLSNPPS